MMAFEIKYDRDRNPIKPTQEPVFEEAAPAPTEAVAENHAQEVETVVENQTLEPEAQAAPEPQPEPVKEAPYKESWKTLRDKAEKAERRAQELEAALQQQQRQSQQQSRPQEQESEQEDPELAPDDLVEAKYVNKKVKKLQEQLHQQQQQLKQQQQQAYEAAVEAKVKMQYPDFDKIVNQETIAMFKTVEPELAAAVNASPDLYAQAVSAYKMIKKLGIVVEDNYQEQKALVQKNAVKPKPMASVSPQQGDSPLSKANAFANGTLTDDLKKQLWKEMNEVRR